MPGRGGGCLCLGRCPGRPGAAGGWTAPRIRVRPDADAHADGHASSYCDSDSKQHTYGHVDSHGHSDSKQYAHSYTDADVDAYVDADSDLYTYRAGDQYAQIVYDARRKSKQHAC